MILLLLWTVLVVASVHLCSLPETTLLSVTTSALLDRSSAGSLGAGRLLQIKTA
jgi:hypothetical protein